MAPVILYVDDQEENLFIFKEMCPSDWEIHLFKDPVEALKVLEEIKPFVILSDNRMPMMDGFQFLEICRGIQPASARIIVTAYPSENVLINAIRQSQVTDFITKPWVEEEFLARIRSAIDTYKAQTQARELESELNRSHHEVELLKSQLTDALNEVKNVHEQEMKLRKELISWVPQFIVESLESGRPLDRVKQNVASITFDIKSSARLFEIFYEEIPIRNKIIQVFVEQINENQGDLESISGDSCYGHFGLMRNNSTPADSALAAAFRFRTAISNLSRLIGLGPDEISVGIAMHFVTELPIHIHSTHFYDENGEMRAQNGFDTSSLATDLVHRIEKLTHSLRGTNFILTKAFLENLKFSPRGIYSLGTHLLKGHKKSVELYLLPDQTVTEEEVKDFTKALATSESAKAASIAS